MPYKLTPKQTLIIELNSLTNGNGAFLYKLIEAAVGMTMEHYKEDRISKTEAEKLYGVSTIKHLEATSTDDLFFRNSGAKNSKKYYSRQAINAAIAKMGWPLENDPLFRKRRRYTKKKKDAK